jgi:hypothetical protein
VSCMSMPYRNPKASYDYARRLMLDKWMLIWWMGFLSPKPFIRFKQRV